MKKSTESTQAERLRHLDQSLRVRAVGRADHEQELYVREQVLDGLLAVRGRVTDVFLLGPVEAREAALQYCDDLARLVH